MRRTTRERTSVVIYPFGVAYDNIPTNQGGSYARGVDCSRPASFRRGRHGQRQKVNINTETPEGQALQQIGQENDEAKKLALMEDFVAKFPKTENTAWVYAQMQPVYIKTGQYDKAMDAGEKVLAIDPGDLEIAHQNLKAAEAKKDPDAIEKWSGQTSEIALKAAASPQPKEEDQVENWKKEVDYAKQVNTYTEYSLSAAALQAQDPKKRIALAEALAKRNPNSQYLPQLNQALFLAYRQAGDNPKAIALAEKILATDQSNEDMLLVVAITICRTNAIRTRCWPTRRR